MTVERDTGKLSKVFHNALQGAKDMWNTNADMKTGRYYVKGQKAHPMEEGSTMMFESDPALKDK